MGLRKDTLDSTLCNAIHIAQTGVPNRSFRSIKQLKQACGLPNASRWQLLDYLHNHIDTHRPNFQYVPPKPGRRIYDVKSAV